MAPAWDYDFTGAQSPTDVFGKKSKKRPSSRKFLAGIAVATSLIALTCVMGILASHCGYALRVGHEAAIAEQLPVQYIHRRDDGNATESDIPVGVSVPVSTQTALSTIYTIRSTPTPSPAPTSDDSSVLDAATSTPEFDTTVTQTTTLTTVVTLPEVSHSCPVDKNSTITVTVTADETDAPAYTDHAYSEAPTEPKVTITSTDTVQRTVTRSVVTVTVTNMYPPPVTGTAGITSSVLGDANTLSTTGTGADDEPLTTTTTVYASSTPWYYPPPPPPVGNGSASETIPPVVSGGNSVDLGVRNAGAAIFIWAVCMFMM